MGRLEWVGLNGSARMGRRLNGWAHDTPKRMDGERSAGHTRVIILLSPDTSRSRVSDQIRAQDCRQRRQPLFVDVRKCLVRRRSGEGIRLAREQRSFHLKIWSACTRVW